MLGTHKIIVDEWAETWDLLKPYADGSFWQLPAELDPEAVYIVGRVVLKENWDAITAWATTHPGRVVFSNPAEGSETIKLQLKRLMITDYVKDGRIGLLTSGDLEPGWNYCKTDCYFSNIVEYQENIRARELLTTPEHREAVRDRAGAKPYDFLFLNGRLRPHRKYIIDGLRARGLLDRALWTNLCSRVEMPWSSALHTGKLEPIRLLPPEYEIDRAKKNLKPSLYTDGGFVKHKLFDNSWGDAEVNPRAYTDTHFSLVTETIYDYPYTFRTEKIWKPVLMAHPFIVASNTGYYRSLHDAGFKTFNNLIDESFDSIENPESRAQRIIDVVNDICSTGAREFALAAEAVCKYNQQHLIEHNRKERAQLPDSLQQYLNERLGI